MNYVILNHRQIFDGHINLKNFKEVGLFDEERADAVFGKFDKHLLEIIDHDTNGRDSVFPGSELLGNAGIFILLKIDRDILLDEDPKFIETIFGLLDQERFFVEIRGFNIKESYNQIEQFIIAYKKELGYVENLCPEGIYDNNIEFILKEIEEKIL